MWGKTGKERPGQTIAASQSPLLKRVLSIHTELLHSQIYTASYRNHSPLRSAGCAPQKTPNQDFCSCPGCFVHEFMSVSLLGAYCSSKSCNDRFPPTPFGPPTLPPLHLFYAELGSVIRAPFLTDRSILITKSSACSKGKAHYMAPPVQPGHDESAPCRANRRQAGRSMKG